MHVGLVLENNVALCHAVCMMQGDLLTIKEVAKKQFYVCPDCKLNRLKSVGALINSLMNFKRA